MREETLVLRTPALSTNKNSSKSVLASFLSLILVILLMIFLSKDLESLITRWMTTFTVTRPSLFPLLVYILLPMAGHLPAFLPTHLDSLSFHLPKSIALRASFKFGSRHSLYKLRNLRTGVNIDEGSARVFGCGELSLGDGRPDGPQGKLSGQPVRSSSESNIDASSASALTSMDLISHTRSGDSNATLL